MRLNYAGVMEIYEKCGRFSRYRRKNKALSPMSLLSVFTIFVTGREEIQVTELLKIGFKKLISVSDI